MDRKYEHKVEGRIFREGVQDTRYSWIPVHPWPPGRDKNNQVYDNICGATIRGIAENEVHQNS